ncbi:hypothetical protein BAE44_0002346 [Dichanthelium oligosanthes]|uniref:Uncharacterized protein n=1 Tax=Dichanthelium oligosanthes TaxID=888268 RepID=A0A1E5WGW0_9POAL|nr:hypothetical protein BAE44_0002346 [Dichanthelium oligosanthes]
MEGPLLEEPMEVLQPEEPMEERLLVEPMEGPLLGRPPSEERLPEVPVDDEKGGRVGLVTGEDEKKAWVRPMLKLLRLLKDAGLTGVRVLWTFFERRVQPLVARAHPLFRYTGAGDSTRTSWEPLTPVEVRSRVWAMIKRAQAEDDITELDRLEAGVVPEPTTRHEGNGPFIVSFFLLRVSCSLRK